MEACRMRKHEIIEPSNVQQRHASFELRLDIGRIEIPGFCRMPVQAEINMKSSFDISRRGFDVDEHAIWVSLGNPKVMRASETQHPLIIGLRRAKPRGELLGS